MPLPPASPGAPAGTAGSAGVPFPQDMIDQAALVVEALKARGVMVATAESCTGGMIMAALTAVAGSSHVADRGFVTYSNEAKSQMLGVPEDMLARHGAVSAEVARAMAEGAVNASQAGLGLAVTGIAGPDGGTPDKPVGLVFMACALAEHGVTLRRQVFAGNRHEVRHATVNAALDLALSCLELAEADAEDPLDESSNPDDDPGGRPGDGSSDGTDPD